MAELRMEQVCPYCDREEEEHTSEWEEGNHTVECRYCDKEYHVETVYTFEGWKSQKLCKECDEPEEDCYCSIEDED